MDLGVDSTGETLVVREASMVEDEASGMLIFSDVEEPWLDDVENNGKSAVDEVRGKLVNVVRLEEFENNRALKLDESWAVECMEVLPMLLDT